MFVLFVGDYFLQKKRSWRRLRYLLQSRRGTPVAEVTAGAFTRVPVAPATAAAILVTFPSLALRACVRVTPRVSFLF